MKNESRGYRRSTKRPQKCSSYPLEPTKLPKKLCGSTRETVGACQTVPGSSGGTPQAPLRKPGGAHCGSWGGLWRWQGSQGVWTEINTASGALKNNGFLNIPTYPTEPSKNQVPRKSYCTTIPQSQRHPHSAPLEASQAGMKQSRELAPTPKPSERTHTSHQNQPRGQKMHPGGFPKHTQDHTRPTRKQ